jgi:hypothetical protein
VALVGTTFKSYDHNTWSTLFNTAPSNLATAGVPLPDGSRFVVELAKITPDNVDNSPAVAWTDITVYVSSLAWSAGDFSGRLSRWPIEQLTVTCADLTALLGDFIEAPPLSGQTGPGPGSFIRWGIISNGTWRPKQTCLVETINDLTAGRVRGWRIAAYGTLLYYSGIYYTRFTSNLTGNINTAMATVCAEFVEGTNFPWPFAETYATQNAAFATDLSPAIVPGTQLPYLQFLHQCADSQAMRVFNTPTGGFQTEEWTAAAVVDLRLTDEATVTVDGHSGADLIGARLGWKRSQDQAAGIVNIGGSGVTASDFIFTKWARRHDAVGFPITDLRSVPTGPQATAMCAAAAGIIGGSEVRLDKISVDTASANIPGGIANNVWPLLTGVQPLWHRCRIKCERRRPGAAWIEVTALVLGIAGVVDFTTGIGHATIDYYTRVIP